MRIAYFVQWELNKDDGVLKKIVSQVNAWKSEGHKVQLFCLSNTCRVSSLLTGIDLNHEIAHSKLSLFFKSRIIGNNIIDFNPDVVYARWGINFPFLLTIMKLFPTILEINSDNLSEQKLHLNKMYYYYQSLTTNTFLKHPRGAISVTNELADRYSSVLKNITVIANGIELDKYKILSPNLSPIIRIIICSPYARLGKSDILGCDKILTLAEYFKDWEFNIVGVSAEERPKNDLPNIHYHGFLDYKSYKSILEQSDVGIGPLALYRKSMSEACPLKVREYLAHGLPIIIGYKDTDFLHGKDFILELPNSDDNVRANFHIIEQFILKWKGKRVPFEDIKHIDSVIKEKKRLDYFNQVAHL